MPKLNYNLDDIPDSIIIPNGRYRGILRSVTKGDSSTGNPMFTWVWRIKGGDQNRQEVRSWTTLLRTNLTQLKEHLIALGVKGKIRGSTDDFIGGAVCLVMGTRQGVNRMGEKSTFSTVLGVLPISKLKKGKVSSTSAKKRRRPVDDDDEDEDDGLFGEDEDEEDEDDDEDDDDEDEDDDDEEEDEPKPSRRQRLKEQAAKQRKEKARRAKRRRDEEEDDEDEDDEDDEDDDEDED